jgi:hypothetical protein
MQFSYPLSMPVVVEPALIAASKALRLDPACEESAGPNRPSTRPRFTNPSDSQATSHHHCIRQNALLSSRNNAQANKSDETSAYRPFRLIQVALRSWLPRCFIICSPFIFLVCMKEILISSNSTSILCNKHREADPFSHHLYTLSSHLPLPWMLRGEHRQ